MCLVGSCPCDLHGALPVSHQQLAVCAVRLVFSSLWGSAVLRYGCQDHVRPRASSL